MKIGKTSKFIKIDLYMGSPTHTLNLHFLLKCSPIKFDNRRLLFPKQTFEFEYLDFLVGKFREQLFHSGRSGHFSSQKTHLAKGKNQMNQMF